ncbi:hypothetical protein WR25_17472 [Diploscapter pachys]|uniref:Uncharacterized protein n=1 Tax=Diploscapter pachys TaxID=2018661 RepID=A0A2A2M4S4_9BILA|nr:hypothetical protein WR25_17472 [Diploscapter pachys]
MPGKDKVRRRRQHFEPTRHQLRNQHLPAVDNLAAGLIEILTVVERRRRPDNRHAIQRIGVEAILDPLQRLDQVGMPHRQANPEPRQRTRLGQGLGHQQVVIAINQADGRFATEIDVGLIDNHHRIPVGLQQLLDRLKRQQAAGRRIGSETRI